MKTDYLNNSKRNIHSTESQTFTFRSKICSNCNDAATQPYDNAWDKCSDYLGRNHQRLIKTKKFYIRVVYKSNQKANLNNLHLYFLKIMAGHLIDKNFVIFEKEHVSSCLLNSHPNKHFLIRFGLYKHLPKFYENATKFPVQVLENKFSKQLERGLASTVYSVGPLCIDLVYCKYPYIIKNLLAKGYWSPLYSDSKSLQLKIN